MPVAFMLLPFTRSHHISLQGFAFIDLWLKSNWDCGSVLGRGRPMKGRLVVSSSLCSRNVHTGSWKVLLGLHLFTMRSFFQHIYLWIHPATWIFDSFWWFFFLFWSPGTGSSILSALQDVPSGFWPCRSKMEKHLQVISVLQWVITFLALGKWECVCVGGRCAFNLSWKHRNLEDLACSLISLIIRRSDH